MYGPFPNPRSVKDSKELIAIGANLHPETLLQAYDAGLFPWYSAGLRPHWWSPNPRGVIDRESLHVSRSLARKMRGGAFTVTWNRDFRRVIEDCAAVHTDGTWILPEMVEAYCQLHTLGHAHSIEVWDGDILAGGLYGVQRGAAFMAESMFHRVTDASKVALARAVGDLWDAGVRLFDVQFLTPHLESMGAYEIRRSEYLDRLAEAIRTPAGSPGDSQ